MTVDEQLKYEAEEDLIRQIAFNLQANWHFFDFTRTREFVRQEWEALKKITEGGK